jgi:hypothetical protein
MSLERQTPDLDSGPLAARHRRCLVLLVPGMSVSEPGLYLSKLVKGLRDHADERQLDLDEESGDRPGDRRRFTLRTSGDTLELDLAESYWSDLRPRLSAEPGLRKVLGGLSLLAFWLLAPRLWARSLRGAYMFANAAGTLVLLLAWYYGAVATLLSASGSDPTLLQPFGLESMGPTLAQWGETMGGWRVWLIVSVVTAFFPTMVVVDVAHAAKAYLKNRDHFATRVKGRLAKSLYAAFKADYDTVVVVAHSFGVGVAVETLSELDATPDSPISLITLGGSLGLLRARSKRVEEAYQRVVNDRRVTRWVDFWSKQDWLGTPALDLAASPSRERLRSQELDASVSFTGKISGSSHGLYFDAPEVYETLLEQAAPAAEVAGLHRAREATG